MKRLFFVFRGPINLNEKDGLAGLLNAEGVDKIRRANTGVNGTLVISTQQSLGRLLSIKLGMNCNTLSSVFPGSC